MSDIAPHVRAPDLKCADGSTSFVNEWRMTKNAMGDHQTRRSASALASFDSLRTRSFLADLSALESFDTVAG